jgi:ATP-dependent Clp protease ATP-binding subunit ClpA
VGKTYLATEFAKISNRPHKVFQMTEYTDENCYLDFFGFEGNHKSPMPGVFTGFVRDNPDAVLIFDEIEKVHGRWISKCRKWRKRRVRIKRWI